MLNIILGLSASTLGSARKATPAQTLIHNAVLHFTKRHGTIHSGILRRGCIMNKLVHTRVKA